MTYRRLPVVLGIVAILLAAGPAAWAYWTLPAAGSGSVATASLSAPADVTATAAPTAAGAVHVTWTGAVLTTGGDAAGYHVQRERVGDGAVTAACGTSAAAPTTSLSCLDPAVPDGTYRYLVTAVHYSWTATGAPSDPVTVSTDTSAPTVALTFPADSSLVNDAAWSTGCTTPGICGTASDDVSIAAVEVSVRQNVTGRYWDGAAFAATGETFHTAAGTTSWTLALARPADGAYTVRARATDTAGNTTEPGSAPTATTTVDATAPAGTVSMTAATGAFLAGSTVYFRGVAAGGFRLVDTITDAGSGPASATFPAITATRWTHAAETVGTPAGGPYTSSAISWTANPGTPGAYGVTSQDAAGNAGTVTLAFVNDSTPPSGGSVDYTDGYYSSLSVPITLNNGTDAGSGVNPATVVLQRSSATLAGGTCGNFGSYALVTLTGGADTTVTASTCYRYRSLVTDNVGNQATFTSAAIARIDTAAPAVNSVALANGGTSGRADQGDTVTLQHSEQMAGSGFCSAWTGNGSQSLTGNGQVTVAITNSGTNDLLTITSTACAFNLGTIALNRDYVSATTTYGGNGSSRSTITLSTGGQLTVTLGAPSSTANLRTGVQTAAPIHTPAAGLTDLAGNALPTTPVTGTTSRF